MAQKKLLIVVAGAIALIGAAAAQKMETRTPDKWVLAEDHTRALLLLMKTDGTSKISKKEWMKFMEAEFDRLDKERKGVVDPQALEQANMIASHQHFAESGK